ncbi:MAG TPA: hypothetical protein VNG33_02495 [Polyangiaceae bacterium]|nr:hypothetical protein [Polyangiaceae bacterium]
MAASLSHSLSTFVIPSPERSDAEPVLGSLAQAHAAFERGEIREALKHLRRAAEGADDAGSELRAVALARAAADLATEVGSLAPPPASAAQSGAHSVAPPALLSAPPSVTPSAPPASASSVRGDGADSALQQLLASGRAVKVVVKRSARDDTLYVVRPADSQAPALGTREAVIVLLEPDDGFFR